MADQVKIQVITSEKVLGHDFVDAIYYSSMAAYDATKADGSHEGEKATRIANYTNAVQNPPVQKEVSKEELLVQKQALLDQVTSLDAQIAVAKLAKDIVAEELIP